MPFQKEDKPKAMTTKDQIDRPVTVVSTQSANDYSDMVIPDVGEKDPFIEVGHPINMDIPTEVLEGKQAVAGTDPAEFVGFAPTNLHINKMRVEDINNFMRDSIIARPLRLPNRLDCRSKDPNWRLRWVEFKAEDGRRYNDCCVMGFRNAKQEEVIWNGTPIKPNSDGTIKDNDVILMIIPCEVIDGAYKYNALRSLQMISKQGSRQKAKEEADAELRSGIAGAGKYANRMRNEIQTFVPTAKDGR